MSQGVKQLKVILNKNVHGKFVSLSLDLKSSCIDPSVKKQEECHVGATMSENFIEKAGKMNTFGLSPWIKYMGTNPFFVVI